MTDFTNMDLSMSESIELGDIRTELSVSAEGGVLELFAEIDDPAYTREDFEKLPSWVTGERFSTGVLFYTSELGKMRELVEVAADFLGVERPQDQADKK